MSLFNIYILDFKSENYLKSISTKMQVLLTSPSLKSSLVNCGLNSFCLIHED